MEYVGDSAFAKISDTLLSQQRTQGYIWRQGSNSSYSRTMVSSIAALFQEEEVDLCFKPSLSNNVSQDRRWEGRH